MAPPSGSMSAGAKKVTSAGPGQRQSFGDPRGENLASPSGARPDLSRQSGKDRRIEAATRMRRWLDSLKSARLRADW